MDPVDVKQFVQKILELGINGLQLQYRQHADYTNPNQKTIAHKANKTCNRYNYVLCQDYNRVILKDSDGKGYIHANFIASPLSTNRMIATQAPKIRTIDDFWKMIVQEDSEIILMLCQISESGLEKSSQYWPKEIGKVRKYGGIRVKNLGSSLTATDSNLIMTSLHLDIKTAAGVKNKLLTHYQYLGWPDQSVPDDFSTVIDLAVRARKSSKPITVHCSAGIGRTGVLSGIILLLDKLSSKQEIQPNTLIQEIRNQRSMAIQSKEQYVYIYRSLLHYFVEQQKMFDHIEDIQNRYKQFARDYQHMMISNGAE